MGRPFRPADRLKPPWTWDSPKAVFDLDGLDAATTIAVLRQWASAPYLRAEVARVAKSAAGFAGAHGVSVNHLRNMLNGHRLPDYATVALVVAIAGPTHAIDEAELARAMTDALARSTPKAAAGAPATLFAGLGDSAAGWDSTGASGQGPHSDVAPPHPDAELIRATFARAVLSDPLVNRYLAADHPRHAEDPEGLSVEVSVFVAPSAHEAGVEAFLTPTVLGGHLWVPANWRVSVHGRGGGLVGDVFVCAAIEGSDRAISEFRGARVIVEAGDSPADWDLAVVTGQAQAGPGNSVTWALL